MVSRINKVAGLYLAGKESKQIAFDLSIQISEVYRCLRMGEIPLRTPRYANRMPQLISMSWPEYKRGVCRYGGREVYITRRGAEIIAILLMRRGTPLKYNELIACIWPDANKEPDWSHNSLKVKIHKLRKLMPGIILLESNGYYIPLPHKVLENRK